MMLPSDIEVKNIPTWCAGIKLCNVHSYNVSQLTKEQVIEALATYGASVAIVSIGGNEADVEKALRKLGFKNLGPKFENVFNHPGQLTHLMYFAPPKADLMKVHQQFEETF